MLNIKQLPKHFAFDSIRMDIELPEQHTVRNIKIFFVLIWLHSNCKNSSHLSNSIILPVKPCRLKQQIELKYSCLLDIAICWLPHLLAKQAVKLQKELITTEAT